MATNIDIYDVGNYFPFDATLGIYDISSSQPFYQVIKSVTYSKVLSVNGELLDSISYKVYDTELLWWVLAIYNDIIDPISIDSVDLKIPNFSEIESAMIDYLEAKRSV
ncbi:hypothetical protein YerA41_184c [Yersinia phage YerA41]|uniref:Uncharacterized protein n=1 Tax=Yersinia phage vB_Yru_GN1 TaxID=3074381 RepID=A0AA86IWJ9_9CAUD|nr:hypothetical protein YerA41_184c [Yersinia phage YerA41]BES79815.1 hypothetical protein [Yersinia phage vB_Yru_GN1]